MYSLFRRGHFEIQLLWYWLCQVRNRKPGLIGPAFLYYRLIVLTKPAFNNIALPGSCDNMNDDYQ